jgi:hypothetical protein
LNAAYVIEGREVQLVDGRAENQAAPGTATMVRTSVFGQPVYGYLDDGGILDAALILVHEPGGSGTFYYIATARNINGAWQGSNAVFLGDRISTQPIEIRNHILIANYADRRFEESMTTQPSVGKSKYLTFHDGRLKEIFPYPENKQN